MGRYRKKRKSRFLWNLLLGIMAGFAFLFWHGAVADHYEPDVYSGQYVGTAEVKRELSFGIYADKDWGAWFGAYPKEYLTTEMLRGIVRELGVADYIEVPKAGKRRAVARAEWNDAYGQILDYLDMEQEVSKETFLVLDSMEAEKNILITNKGDVMTALPESYFENWHAYSIYMMEGECLGISEIFMGEQQVENAYLKSLGASEMVFLYGGAQYQIETGELEESLQPGVCDLVFVGGVLDAVRVKQDAIRGELLSYDGSQIEIEGYVKMGHPQKLPVYQTYGEVLEKSLSDVVLGNMEAEYIVAGEEICAVLIRQPAAIENIRVLLLSSDGTKYREDVYLKCSSSASVQCGDMLEQVEAGRVVAAADYLAQGDSTLAVSPAEDGGQIFLCTQDGTAISNGYSGSMEARRFGEGIVLVNSLPFETYLCAVVPSEMPSTYAPEALKAQAVCARSYAYIQLLRADLAEYGAHIDDSTAYQVYNKVAPTEASQKAVRETAGKVLTYQGETVEAYYFSTSMGYTGTAEIWNMEHPSEYAYLQSACLNTQAYEGDLSKEEDFAAYIQNKAEGYDSDVKYYRWFATADYRGKTGEINQILRKRREVSERNIICGNQEGDFSAALASFGSVTGLSVDARASCGAILALSVQYEHGNVLVKNEYNIRQVLGCGVQEIVYADGSSSKEVSLLPSAYCTVAAQQDGTLLLQGGGYGHGLGMSQNGANGMAKAGMGYEEILQHFYHDVKIDRIQE